MFSADLGVTPSSTLYAEDVFSTYLYTGSGATLAINNGLDLNGKGGMVWIKDRGATNNGAVHDKTNSVRLTPSSTIGADGTSLFSWLSNGFQLNATFPSSNNFLDTNQSGRSYVSWSFRKAPKFFDVVAYTGNGTNQSISHSLGVAPGLIICKAISTSGNWFVYNNALGNQVRLYLNSTAIWDYWSYWNDTTPTSTTFSIGPVGANDSGVSYVAYLFADDTTSTGLIRCGSFTTDASGNASVTTLGWEPQFLMVKAATTTGDWIMLDTMRGWNMTSADALLRANLSNAETTTTEYGNPTATGFDFKGGAASATYVYMAIRQPNKPPTSGSGVFFVNATVAGDPASPSTSLVGIRNMDMAILGFRGGGDSRHALTADKLRGFKPSTDKTTPYLSTTSTAVETTSSSNLYVRSFNGLENHLFYDGVAGQPLSAYAFKRAPGFFDVVCYTGDGASAQRTLSHNLNAAPELIFTKARSGTGEWFCIAKNGTQWAITNSISFGPSSSRSAFLSSSTITMSAAVFSCNTYGADFSSTNASGVSYVSYLFASLPGISKIGVYTGNGTTQTIDCGFAAGARFVLIKRTDAAGDWYVWDTARGIVAATDPHLSLNSTAAEVTTDDSVDPVSSGFAVDQLAATNINVSSATYLYFAIA